MSNLPVLKDLSEWFAKVLQYFGQHLSFLGAHRWAAAIILLTIAVRTALLPLAIKQVRSMQAMQRVQPEIKRLQQKYKKDKQKLNQEMMELYKREGVNPLGGCLPLLAQMPVLFAMYYAIRKITTPTRAQWLKLGVRDPGSAVGFGVRKMPFLALANNGPRSTDGCAMEALKIGKKTVSVKVCGLAAASLVTWAGILLLVLMTVTTIITSRQMSATQDPQQQRMAMLMPLMFLVIMVRFPAALVLYWTTQNVYQLVQQTIMLKTQTVQPPGKGKAAKPKR